MVIRRCRNACQVPEIAFPLVQTRVLASSIEQEHMRCTLNQPTAIKALYAALTHGIKRARKVRVFRLLRLDLHGCRLVAKGSDEAVSVAKLLDGDGDLGLDDGVDTADLVGDLPCALEEEGVADVALYVGHAFLSLAVVVSGGEGDFGRLRDGGDPFSLLYVRLAVMTSFSQSRTNFSPRTQIRTRSARRSLPPARTALSHPTNVVNKLPHTGTVLPLLSPYETPLSIRRPLPGVAPALVDVVSKPDVKGVS